MLSIIVAVILVVGVIHGLILMALLFRVRQFNSVGTTSLFVGLFAIWSVVVEESIVASGLWTDVPHILRLTTWMPFLIGPSIWLFVSSLTTSSQSQFGLLHFLPAGFAFAYFLPFYLQSGDDKIAFVNATTEVPIDSSILGVAKIVSVICYCTYSLVWLRQNRLKVASALSKWTQVSLTVFLVFILPLVVLFAAEHRWANIWVSSDLIGAVYLATVMYALSLIMLLFWRSFAAGTQALERYSNVPPDRKDGRIAILLDEATAQSMFDDLSSQVITRELYKTPGISVSDLAELVGVAQHYLSYVVNTCSGKNVTSWLNGLRVDAAKKLLLANRDLSILQAALDAGFNSKAAFNRVFKNETGMTPTAYRANH